ncbi:MAG: tetratricopeptide repeat protein [Planctomycetes bacterium]|nr:tetratricopeptide repeat protein [Planctomycetota bacterium]
MARRCQAVLGLIALIFASSSSLNCVAQDMDEETQRAISERFATVLEKHPRRGTAFDKVYGYHVEHGSLNELLKHYQDRADQNHGVDSAVAWMIVGLIESQRGRDVDAVRALTNAERLDPTSAMASYQLGQALVMTGQTDQAAAAFERAIQRQPAASDLMDIYQALGRVYQRSQKNDQALEVWNRLEAEFPNDARVQEQIATVLLEENELAAALPRFEKLAASARDKQRQSQFQIEAADIKVKLGRTDEGLQDFDRLLQQLNPESWLFRDVRRRIEAVYQRNNNPAGLIAYHEKWIDRHPDDLDAVSRLARLFISLGRGNEAERRLQQVLKQAPSNRELRLVLINHLLGNRKYHEAANQFRELEKHDPSNPDVLREWGRAVLKDDDLQDDDQRHQEARRIWRKLLTARPQDAHVASQVADLFRRAGMVDDAIDCFQMAIRLAPDSGQYREYLGEYLRSQDRMDEAIATWREIASGSRRNASNLARLAEILAANGRVEEAIEANAAACLLDPKDLNLQLKQADLLSRGDRHEESLTQLLSVGQRVASDEEREAVLKRELAELTALNRLKTRITEVRAALEADPASDPLKWYWLARAYEAAAQPHDGLQAILQGLKLRPDSIPMLTAAAHLHETQKLYEVATELNTRLAVIDRRFRSEHLKRIATLEEKRGRRTEALKAGRDYLTAAAGNPGASDFFAGLCFRQGEYEEGIQTLRRAVRMNPSDQETLIKLAMALVEHGQTTEAIELLWRAFDRAKSLEERLAIVQVLAEVLAKRNDLNRLYIRLERDRRDPALHREMTLCLGRAYETVGDFATAQRKLESLAVEGTRDTDLLTHLRSLAERQRDYAAAARFQRQLWQITGNAAERYRLAEFLFQANREEEALELLTLEAGERELNAELLKLLDGMYQRQEDARLQSRLKILRAQFPDDWELLYREAVALSHTSRDEAVRRFEELLRLNCEEDNPSRLSSGLPLVFGTSLPLPLVSRLSNMRQFQLTSNLPQIPTRSRVVSGTNLPHNWVNPHDYGVARMAAWGWLLRLTPSSNFDLNEFMQRHAPSRSPVPTRRDLMDQISILAFQNKNEQKRDVIRKLMQLSEDDLEARVLFLQSIGDRNPTLNQVSFLGGSGRQQNSPALDNASLDEVVRVYRTIDRRTDLIPLKVFLLRGVVTELTLGNRSDSASELFADAVQNAADLQVACLLLQFDQQLSDMKSTRRLLDLMFQHSAAANSRTFLASAIVATRLAPLLKTSNQADDMLVVWKQYLRLATEEMGRLRIAGSAGQTPNAPVQGAVRFTGSGQVYYITGISVSQGSADMPGFIYGDAARSMLTSIRREFLAAKRGDELISLLAQEIQGAGPTTLERLYWQHALAYIQWNAFQSDESFRLLEAAIQDFGADRLPNNFDLRGALVRQYESVSNFSKALALLDQDTGPRNPDAEKKILHLAIVVRSLERAKAAVQRLTAERVEHKELVKLAPLMLELGLLEEVEKMLKRTAETESLDLAPLQILMDVQLKQGKKHDAAQTVLEALHILDHRRPGGSAGIISYQLDSSDGARPLTVKTSTPEEFRQHCHQVLRATGQLESLIDADERTLAEGSPPEKLLTRMIGLHTVAGNDKRAAEVTIVKLTMELADSPNRFPLILKYVELEQYDEAFAQMNVMVQSDCREFASRCRDFLFRFERSKSLAPFARLLAQIDWCVHDPTLATLNSIVTELHNRPATEEFGDQLFVKMWKQHPEHRREFVRQFQTDHMENLITTISELKPESLVQYFENFDGIKRLTLPLSVESQGVHRHLKCRWDDLWPGILQDEVLTTRLTSALKRQREAHGDDLPLLILSIQFASAARQDNLVTTLMDTIVRKIESRQSETKATATNLFADEVALWLIARRCLNQPALVQQGELLGRRSLRSCRQAGKIDLGRVILDEWMQIAKTTGDETTIERLTAELEMWAK